MTQNETLEKIAAKWSGEDGAAFAMAAAKKLNQPLVLFTDQNETPIMLSCHMGNNMFFDASGPVSGAQLWQRIRLPMQAAKIAAAKAQEMFAVSDDEISLAEQALDALLPLLASHKYH